jgi:hypothetical protein
MTLLTKVENGISVTAYHLELKDKNTIAVITALPFALPSVSAVLDKGVIFNTAALHLWPSGLRKVPLPLARQGEQRRLQL